LAAKRDAEREGKGTDSPTGDGGKKKERNTEGMLLPKTAYSLERSERERFVLVFRENEFESEE